MQPTAVETDTAVQISAQTVGVVVKGSATLRVLAPVLMSLEIDPPLVCQYVDTTSAPPNTRCLPA